MGNEQIFSEMLDRQDVVGKIVLDAGAGPSSHLFLAKLRPSRLDSISIDKDIVAKCKGELPYEFRDFVDFKIVDVIDMKKVYSDNHFDVVMADFLIAGIAGWTPFMEIEAIRELYRVMKPGGILVFVGWEQPSRVSEDRAEKLVVSMYEFVDIARMLTGEKVYREFPLSWTLERLIENGFEIERVEEYRKPLGSSFFDNSYAKVSRILNKEQDKQLKEALLAKLKRIVEEGKQCRELEHYQGDFLYAIKCRK